jgi:hypothetical protein
MTSIKLLCRRSVAIPRSHRGGKFRAHHKIRERGSLYMSRRRSSSTFAAPVKSSRREPSKSGLWPELNGPGAILIRNKSLLTRTQAGRTSDRVPRCIGPFDGAVFRHACPRQQSDRAVVKRHSCVAHRVPTSFFWKNRTLAPGCPAARILIRNSQRPPVAEKLLAHS